MLITYQAKLLEKRPLTEDVYHFTFARPDDTSWNFKAGQYMIFHVPQPDNHPVRRLYSIASPPSQPDTMDFIIEFVPNGLGSAYLSKMNVGESATLQGPAGIFTVRDNKRDKIFLATGTGVAPMHSMLHTILHSPQDGEKIDYTPLPNAESLPKSAQALQLYLFWGMKNCDDMYYLDEFKKMAEVNMNFMPQLCFSRETSIESVAETARKYAALGRVTNGFEALLTKLTVERLQPLSETLNSFDYYLCGSHPVVESLRQYLAEKGVAKENIIFEKFTAGA